MVLIVPDNNEKVAQLKHFYLLDHVEVVLTLQLISHYKHACPEGLHFTDMLDLMTNGQTRYELGNKDRKFIVGLLNRMAATNMIKYHTDSKSYEVTDLGYDYLWDEYKNI